MKRAILPAIMWLSLWVISSVTLAAPSLPVITPQNAAQLVEIGRFGDGSIRSAAWSPDGQHLAVAETLGIRLYDSIDAPSTARFLDEDPTSIMDVQFSPDGEQFVSRDLDNTFRLWDVKTGHSHVLADVLTGRIAAFVYTSFGVLAAYQLDQDYMVWNLTSGEQQTIVKQAAHPLVLFSFSADGKKVAYLTIGGELHVWDIDHAEEAIAPIQLSGRPADLTLSPNGQMIAYVVSDPAGDSLALLDLQGGEKQAISDGLPSRIRHVAFSPDSQFITLPGSRISNRVWDVHTGKSVHEVNFDHPTLLRSIFSPGGDKVAIIGLDGAWVWTLDSGNLQPLAAGLTLTSSMNTLNAQQHLVAMSDLTKIELWDLSTGQKSRDFLTIRSGGLFFDIMFSPDGQYLAAGMGGGGTVFVGNVQHPDLFATIRLVAPNAGGMSNLAFSPDNRFLAAVVQDAAHLWQISNQHYIGATPGKFDFNTRPAFTPNGDTLIGVLEGDANTNSTEEQLALISTSTLEIARKIDTGYKGFDLKSFAVSPDGKTITAIGGRVQTVIRQWSIGGEPGAEWFFGGNTGEILTYSPNGQLLAIGDSDGAIYLLDPLTGDKIVVLRGHKADVNNLSFSEDGQTLVSTSDDGTIRLWGIPAA